MSDPSLALQGALFKALRAAGVAAGQVFDKVPDDAEFPYVTIGDDQVIGDDDECQDASRVTSRIHGWSRAPGFPEVKAIAGSIRTAVMAASLAIDGFEIIATEFVQTQFLRDPDGLTSHSVTEFSFLITHTG